MILYLFKSSIATTFSAAAYARLIFPCYDEPHLKATFKLTVGHQSNFSAISNMPVEKTTDVSGSWITTSFLNSGKMSTYLFAFTISDFSSVKNAARNFSVYVRKVL